MGQIFDELGLNLQGEMASAPKSSIKTDAAAAEPVDDLQVGLQSLRRQGNR